METSPIAVGQVRQMADQKSSGGTLLLLAALGAAGLGGYALKTYQQNKAIDDILAKAKLRAAAESTATPPAEDAADITARCLDALAGQCIETPCTLEKATRLALARDPANGADVARDTMLEVCLNAKESDEPKTWAIGLMSRVKLRGIDEHRRSARFCTLDESVPVRFCFCARRRNPVRSTTRICRRPSVPWTKVPDV
ncbi:MAG: hypothetical protein FJ100_17540 [Deltaproteobacteria bacterium]|nr:hypothetical protein [Deltaproteobacteria bacterium]